MNIHAILRAGIVSLFCIVIVHALFPARVFAHIGGPPYVKINAQYAQTNPILNTFQPVTITVGSDLASPSGLIVHEPVTFEIDEQFFPNPYLQAQNPFGIPVVNQKPTETIVPEFRWDFKDGSEKKEGRIVTHTYNTEGTYIIDLDVKFPNKSDDFAPVNTIQVTILPSKGYVLPKAVIHVNTHEIQEPLKDVASVASGSFISFDASGSTGTIKTYQWDFGDEKGANKKKIEHRYARDQYFPTVVLRVIDDQNIVSDTYALINLPFEKSNIFLSVYYAIIDFFTGLFHRE